MCSGARSSSAKGAMAWRASVASSWSTSSRMVLSLWTISGPSFTRGSPSLAQFLCSLNIDDAVDGEHPLGFLGRIEDPDASAVDGKGNDCLQTGVALAVHYIHAHPLL